MRIEARPIAAIEVTGILDWIGAILLFFWIQSHSMMQW